MGSLRFLSRMYEVIMHGCVPVIISEAFHAAFEHTLSWESFALFVHRRQIRQIPAMLKRIPEER